MDVNPFQDRENVIPCQALAKNRLGIGQALCQEIDQVFSQVIHQNILAKKFIKLLAKCFNDFIIPSLETAIQVKSYHI